MPYDISVAPGEEGLPVQGHGGLAGAPAALAGNKQVYLLPLSEYMVEVAVELGPSKLSLQVTTALTY